MREFESRGRRRFLGSVTAGLPAALMGAGTAKSSRDAVRAPADRGASPHSLPVVVGDDAISFRKHTIDLGISETVTVADLNRDGRLDIVSGENWYEQVPSQSGEGPRFVKHKFRDIGYTEFYVEDLSDLAIDITGDGFP